MGKYVIHQHTQSGQIVTSVGDGQHITSRRNRDMGFVRMTRTQMGKPNHFAGRSERPAASSATRLAGVQCAHLRGA
jgi:hypothetical protein